MIFEALWESAQRGELLLIDGGFCHWHKRRDGVVVIREIIATRSGAGSEMLAALQSANPVAPIVAKCPTDLAASSWYPKKGFRLVANETTKRGRSIGAWRLDPC